MGRISGRDAEATRRLVLDAAAEQIGTHGTEASLDSIAARAGVSKGGLKYHFVSKEALLRALAEDQLLAFREEVLAFVDTPGVEAAPNEAPGSLVRAYLRATLSALSDAAGVLEKHALMSQLSTVPVVREACREDAAWWDEALANDGLDPVTTSVVVSAADGLAAAPLWGVEHSQEHLNAVMARLDALTHATSGRP